MIKLAKKGLRVLKQDGFTALVDRGRSLAARRQYYRDYRDWIERYETLTNDEIEAAKRKVEEFRHQPLISVLMPVYNVDAKWLRMAIDSVREQIYPDWQLCIADDHSTVPHIREILDDYSRADDRIKVVYRGENGHISAASNSALELVDGEFTALMDHDDVLSPTALYFVAKEINECPAADIIFSDEDKIDARGLRFAPTFKPDWSPELMNSFNLFTHLVVYRTSMIKRLGFRLGFEGSQDYDLALRAIRQVPAGNIRHIPRVLYHWRAIGGSVALASDEKQYAHERARTAISEHLRKSGIAATAVKGVGETHRLKFDVPDPLPLVTAICFGDATGRDAITRTAAGYSVEVIATDSRLAGSSTKGLYQQLNAVAKTARGELLLFLNGSTVEMSAGSIAEMAGFGIQPEVGAVGAKLVYPDGIIKSAGLVIGLRGGVGSLFQGKKSTDLGNSYRLAVIQNVSAVPVDCLMVRRSVFDEIGGFDAESFPDSCGDVDLCLRLLEKGYRNVWTPWAEIVQSSRNEELDKQSLERLKVRWPDQFRLDKYFNPNLSLESVDLKLASPPRLDKY